MGLPKRAKFVDEVLQQRFSMPGAISTQILYRIAYKQGAVYLHGMWASLARSLEMAAGSDEVDREGYCEMNLGTEILVSLQRP